MIDATRASSVVWVRKIGGKTTAILQIESFVTRAISSGKSYSDVLGV